MKSGILSMAFLLAAPVAFAQTDVVDYQYKNNSFSVAQQEKQLTNASTGKLFYSRIHAFDSFSNKSLLPYMSRENFVIYLDKFYELPKIANMNGYDDYIPAIAVLYNNIKGLSRLSAKDDHRYSLYEISAPVYKVIDESWGNDIVSAVIQEAYLNLYDYVQMRVKSGDRAFSTAMSYVNMDPIKTDESRGHCQYTVNIDKPVLKKDNIEVYFSDLALFKKITKQYSAPLLQGPIPAWQSMKAESDVVRALLQAYESKRELPAYYVYGYKLQDFGNPATVQQNLHKDMKWFVWVFRNGMLYYSYMAIPCADLSKTTVYEERPVAGLDDAAKAAGGL